MSLRGPAKAEAGAVGLEADRIDHERLTVPSVDGMSVERGLNVGRLCGGHVDDTFGEVAGVIELPHHLVLPELDRLQLVKYRAADL
jgi:hypothetical protein